MQSQHSQALPLTCIHGTPSLDHIWVTPALLPAIRHCGYKPYGHRIHSDHRGFYLDFDAEKLFGTLIATLNQSTPRTFSASNPREVSAYLQRKHAFMKDHNMYQRAQNLDSIEQIKAFGADLTQASRHTDNPYKSPTNFLHDLLFWLIFRNNYTYSRK